MEHHIHTAAPVEINRRSAARRQSGRRRGLRGLGAICVLLLLVGLAAYAFTARCCVASPARSR
ncbi:hypothetical protein BH23GEM5_BH23GEM5_27640 [soil metagenome]